VWRLWEHAVDDGAKGLAGTDDHLDERDAARPDEHDHDHDHNRETRPRLRAHLTAGA
jgi:hypothetical protein